MKKEKKYKPTGKTHEVKTVKDLFALFTIDNLPYIMTDLHKTAELMVNLNEINKQSSGKNYQPFELPIWKWIDDGKCELSEVTISDKNGNSWDLGKDIKDLDFDI